MFTAEAPIIYNLMILILMTQVHTEGLPPFHLPLSGPALRTSWQDGLI